MLEKLHSLWGGNQYLPFATIDVETAMGFEVEYQPICAIAICCSAPDGSLQDPQKYLVQPPQNKISPDTTAVHGITPAMTKSSPSFSEVWEVLKPHIENRILVAHNADFDSRIIEAELERNQIVFSPQPYTCTLDLARAALPQEKSHGLKDLSEKFDIPLDHHDPASDALAAGLLLNLLMKAEKRNNPIKLSQKLGVPVGTLGQPPRWKDGLRPWERTPHFRKIHNEYAVCAPRGTLRKNLFVEVTKRSKENSFIKITGEVFQTETQAGGQFDYSHDFEDITQEEFELWATF